MAMIMSVQRLKESGEERERGELGKYLQTRQQRAPLRWLQEQIEAHTFSQSRNRERDSLGGGRTRCVQVE